MAKNACDRIHSSVSKLLRSRRAGGRRCYGPYATRMTDGGAPAQSPEKRSTKRGQTAVGGSSKIALLSAGLITSDLHLDPVDIIILHRYKIELGFRHAVYVSSGAY